MDDVFVGDCERCVGLCCVALERSRSGGFGDDAPAGTPCRNLLVDHRCAIHATLRRDGWPACTVFDCFGAGQHVTQVTFAGRADWRHDPTVAPSLFATFGILRHVFEMLRLLDEARGLAVGDVHARVAEALDELTEWADRTPDQIATIDLAAWRDRVGHLLESVSRQWRTPVPTGRGSKRLCPRAHLMGANLRGQRLDGLSLRGALLIAADLRDATFARTDLLGADLRDANLGGADLRGAIFLTQTQVFAAHGDERTRLPDRLNRPAHWPRGAQGVG